MKELRRQLKELLQQAGADVFEGQVFMIEEDKDHFWLLKKMSLMSLRRKGDKKKPEQTWQSYC